MKYTQKQLKQYQLRDQLTDIRCAYRDGMDNYAMSIERDVIQLASNRAVMDQYGWFTPIPTTGVKP